MPYRAVLFDLDGTLLDTLDDIADSANAVLLEQGYPVHETDAYRHFVGNGVRVLFERAMPENERNAEAIERCVARFRDVYDEGWRDKTRLFDGVSEMLDGLVDRGLALAVLSNKPHTFTEKCVGEYLSSWPIAPVVGQRDGIPHKPDPTGALTIASQLNVPPGGFLYVGDTSTDMQTARAVGMYPVGVSWGFRSEEELRDAGAASVIEEPRELLEFFQP